MKRRPPNSNAKPEEPKLSGTQNGQRVNHGIVKFKEFEQIYLSPKMPTTFVLGELIFQQTCVYIVG